MNRIREVRTAHKLSQKELAQKLAVTQSTLSNWERNMFDPDIKALRQMSELFTVTVDYLLGASETQINLDEVQIGFFEDFKALDAEDRASLQKMAAALRMAKNQSQA